MKGSTYFKLECKQGIELELLDISRLLTTNSLSVFDQFVGIAFKEMSKHLDISFCFAMMMMIAPLDPKVLLLVSFLGNSVLGGYCEVMQIFVFLRSSTFSSDWSTSFPNNNIL